MEKFKKTLVPILCFIMMGCSCQNTSNSKAVLDKRSKFFVSYMRETFPEVEIKDGDYLFILPTGCWNCVRSMTEFLLSNESLIKGKYNAILVSQYTLGRLSEDILHIDDNVLCDQSNKLDRMAFGISGISILKIKNKKIVAYKSMTVETFQNPEKFFEN